MDFVDLVWHAAGFVAPAATLAVAIVLLSRILWPKSPPALALSAQIAIQFAAGFVVLLVGLAVSAHDGRMWTYGALALCAGTVQWILLSKRAKR